MPAKVQESNGQRNNKRGGWKGAQNRASGAGSQGFSACPRPLTPPKALTPVRGRTLTLPKPPWPGSGRPRQETRPRPDRHLLAARSAQSLWGRPRGGRPAGLPAAASPALRDGAGARTPQPGAERSGDDGAPRPAAGRPPHPGVRPPIPSPPLPGPPPGGVTHSEGRAPRRGWGRRPPAPGRGRRAAGSTPGAAAARPASPRHCAHPLPAPRHRPRRALPRGGQRSDPTPAAPRGGEEGRPGPGRRGAARRGPRAPSPRRREAGGAQGWGRQPARSRPPSRSPPGGGGGGAAGERSAGRGNAARPRRGCGLKRTDSSVRLLLSVWKDWLHSRCSCPKTSQQMHRASPALHSPVRDLGF